MEWKEEFPGTDKVEITGVVNYKKEKKLSHLIGKIFRMKKGRKITYNGKNFSIRSFHWCWTKVGKPEKEE